MAVPADQNRLVQLLQASLNPQKHREAEKALVQEENSQGFSIALLQITASQALPKNDRLAAALCFKNFIRRSWADEDGNHKLPVDEVATIKNQLVGLMITVPSAIQAQLGDAISIIAESDFYEKWNTLVPDLVSRLTPNNTVANCGVLQVAHSVFGRWRPLFRSDALWTEILHVLEHFTQPFVAVLQNTDAQIDQSANDQVALQQLFATMNVAMQLLYDLSCQELPDAFGDNMQHFVALLQKYLLWDNSLLQTSDDTEIGPLEECKASVLEVLTLWAQKYEDDINRFMPEILNTTWSLLTILGTQTKYDIVASRALSLLTTVCSRPTHAANFGNEQNLGQIVREVIVPNITLRESDVELFEDEPVEFTRRDLEGSDSETRRRAATDFMRKLVQHYEELATKVINEYITAYLHQYTSDRTRWRDKDTAIYLFCAIAPIGAVTSSQGVVTTNPHLDVLDFFQKHVAGDLVSSDAQEILQVDAIKFLYIFRSQMTRQQWNEAFPLLVRHLGSSNYVVHTYCAVAVERILNLSIESNEPVIPRSTIQPLAKDVLQQLFLLIQKDTAPEKIQENEFLMRCVMRVLIVLREDCVALTDMILTNFVNILRVIRHNPSNPRFYYYLFEGIGALIRFAAPVYPDKFENDLYSSFADILQELVQEFMPYVFQLLAALLEANPSRPLSEHLKTLVAPTLTPELWESKGNVPALVRLLSSLITRHAQAMSEREQIIQILGIFQRLLSRKYNDNSAFDLLESIVINFPSSALQPFFKDVFILLFQRLEKSSTEVFRSRFTTLYHLMSAKDSHGYGTDTTIALVDSVQDGIFRNIYPSIILPETQKLTKPVERKLAVVSFTKTLAYSNTFAEQFAQGGWPKTCEGLLKLMLNAPDIKAAQLEDRRIQDQDVDDLSFGVGFTQLTTCAKLRQDFFPEISNLKIWIGSTLQEGNEKSGGRLSKLVQERLSPELQQALTAYMSG